MKRKSSNSSLEFFYWYILLWKSIPLSIFTTIMYLPNSPANEQDVTQGFF